MNTLIKKMDTFPMFYPGEKNGNSTTNHVQEEGWVMCLNMGYDPKCPR
jgi:hypothetical protein